MDNSLYSFRNNDVYNHALFEITNVDLHEQLISISHRDMSYFSLTRISLIANIYFSSLLRINGIIPWWYLVWKRIFPLLFSSTCSLYFKGSSAWSSEQWSMISSSVPDSNAQKYQRNTILPLQWYWYLKKKTMLRHFVVLK
jgi:hypothetical protein